MQLRTLTLGGFFLLCFVGLSVAVQVVKVDCDAPTGINTMTQARDAVRKLQPLSASVEVHVTGNCIGAIQASLTLHPDLDSGVFPHTITYKQDPSSSKPAYLSGGSPLVGTNFTPASNKLLPPAAPIVQYDLSGIDFGETGIGEFKAGGLGQCSQTRAELFFNRQPMMVARYPNAPLGGSPWMDWLYVNETDIAQGPPTALEGMRFCGAQDLKVPAARRKAPCRLPAEDEGTSPTTTFSAYNSDHALGARFLASTTAPGADVWLHGFWSFDWADSYIRLNKTSEVDASTGLWEFTYDPATVPVYGVKPHARFYIVNSIAELDAAGEYYIDADTMTLYFYPPEPITADSEIYISLMTEPVVQSVPSSSNPEAALHDVQFDGLTVMYGRGVGMGFPNATRVVVNNMIVSNVGLDAVILSGRDAVISNLVSSGAGCTGVGLSGGDPLTLVPSNVTIKNSEITEYARWTRTYNPGVHFAGVGIIVTGNTIGHAPHNGLLGGGNNHHFAHNYLHDLCYEVRDSGAFYIGRSWVDRGMILDSNTFVNISILEPTELGSGFVYGMYFDDEQSGVTATNNLCSHVDVCFIVGGGRDNILTGNRVEYGLLAFMFFDDRGLNWQHAFCLSEFPLQLKSVNFTNPPYSIVYPGIVNSLTYKPCTPVNNAIIGNSWCNTPTFSPTTTAALEGWGSFASENFNDTKC